MEGAYPVIKHRDGSVWGAVSYRAAGATTSLQDIPIAGETVLRLPAAGATTSLQNILIAGETVLRLPAAGAGNTAEGDLMQVQVIWTKIEQIVEDIFRSNSIEW